LAQSLFQNLLLPGRFLYTLKRRDRVEVGAYLAKKTLKFGICRSIKREGLRAGWDNGNTWWIRFRDEERPESHFNILDDANLP
jgi:hypothetical protein